MTTTSPSLNILKVPSFFFGRFSSPTTMPNFYSIFFIWVIFFLIFFLTFTSSSSSSSSLCQSHFLRQPNRNDEFKQKTNRFYQYEEQSNTWVEVKLPFDLLSCLNETCTKVGTIINDQAASASKNEESSKREEQEGDFDTKKNDQTVSEFNFSLPSRKKRVSLRKMTEASIWVTGESGSIYERFWNGVQWVIAPHDLPVLVGPATSILIVNQTILALSESGNLYQMQLSESSQPIWVELAPILDHHHSASRETEQNSAAAVKIKSGVVSYNGERVFFCTTTGSLLEVTEIEPPRWVNHGRPPGANVAAIADAATIRPEVVFTISSSGDLYEYDKSSKPSWKKHIRREGSKQDTCLIPLKGSSLYGINGPDSISLFLLTKGGDLVERRLHHRKWKWVVHGSPKDHQLTSITPVSQDELNGKLYSLFLTTASGYVFEYRIPKHSGKAQDNPNHEKWVNHVHPQLAKAARGISGLQFQVGRMVFPLDDGRLAELHLSGIGGESSGPIYQQVNARKRASNKYVWSILDAPETEGWNAEYCTDERGPLNCLTGIKDEQNDLESSTSTRLLTRRRKGSQPQEYYLPPSTTGEKEKDYIFPENWTNTNFRLRVMHSGRAFFLITDDGSAFEYLYTENIWLWLRHDHSTAIKGALGNYNGSLFLVDKDGSLLIRERSDKELGWINCTAMRKGRQVNGGPPWDGSPRHSLDALFFVSKNGRLLQFTVAQRKFKWKDCRYPANSKIACIIDQEVFRGNIVFVVGRNGRLYQYNKVTELWHEHYQSQHLVLSRLPGTAMRSSSSSVSSLAGSLFMILVNGGLVEYQWNALDGWNWIEHGKPCKTVTLVGSTGPSFEGNQLFLIGSDGKVYLRYLDQFTWKWKNFGFPHMVVGKLSQIQEKDGEEETSCDDDLEKDEKQNGLNENCDSKVASTRPIPFAEDSVIFELRDGRLAEMRRVKTAQWIWSRTIGTPPSLCIESYWAALAS